MGRDPYPFWLWPLGLALLCAGCTELPKQDGPPAEPVDIASIPDAVPRLEPLSRYGNPPSYVVNGKRYFTRNTSRGYRARGIASWYGGKFHGRRTSSGETYDMFRMTAAHTTLPLPSYVKVTNLQNGRQAIVRINDRGPFHPGRILDLSYVAAAKLGIADDGTGLVEVRAIGSAPPGDSSERPVATARPGCFYVQAGAFHSLVNAERLKARLSVSTGVMAGVSEWPQENGSVFRVRLGPLESGEEAVRLASKLVAVGIGNPHIIEGEEEPLREQMLGTSQRR